MIAIIGMRKTHGQEMSPRRHRGYPATTLARSINANRKLGRGEPSRRSGESDLCPGAEGSELLLQARDVALGAGGDENTLVDRDYLVSAIGTGH